MKNEIKKQSLFSLVSTAQEIKQELIDNEGELTTSLEDRLTANEEQLEEKAVAYAYTIDSIKKDLELLKDMEKQIRARKKKLEGSIERIKGALLTGLNICDIKTIEGGAYRITVGKKKDSVNYVNEDIIPEEFFTEETKVIKKLDKSLVLQTLKNGNTIPGVELITDTEGNNQLYIK